MSDTHFHNWTEFSKPDEEYANSRLAEQIQALESVFNMAQKEDAIVLFAGDLFHKRQSVDTRVFNAVFDMFEKYSDVVVHGIPGNHDKVTNSLYSDSSIDTFNHIPNTTIYTEMEQISVGDVALTMIPYGDEVEEIKEYLNSVEVEEDKINILVAHLGVSGSLVGSGGHRLEGAFTYTDLQPDKFDYIMLGHYHRPQELQGNMNHVYVGVLTQNTFSDEGHAPGVVMIDTDKGIIERKEIASTKFITVDGANIPEDIEEVIETSYVRFRGSREQARALENVTEDLSNIRISVEELKEVETRIEIDSSTDPVTITEKYMEEYYPNSKDKAMECIREAMSNVKV